MNTMTEHARGFLDVSQSESPNLIRVDGRRVAYQPVAPYAQLGEDTEELHRARQDVFRQIDEYFGLVADTMYDEPELQEELLTRLQKAKERAHQSTEATADGDPAWSLGRAQFYVRRVHVTIARAQRSRMEERRLRWVVPGLFLFYIVVIVGVVLQGARLTTLDEATGAQKLIFLPVINVPLSVLVWAALGSVAAILYRFYTVKQGTLADELRWLIARPLIGVIMGALSYIAIVSGLFIFGSATNVSATVPNPNLLWVIAFFGGFSDRFFGTLIDTVVGYLPSRQVDSNPSTSSPPPEAAKAGAVTPDNGSDMGAAEDDLPDMLAQEHGGAPAIVTAR